MANPALDEDESLTGEPILTSLPIPIMNISSVYERDGLHEEVENWRAKMEAYDPWPALFNRSRSRSPGSDALTSNSASPLLTPISGIFSEINSNYEDEIGDKECVGYFAKYQTQVGQQNETNDDENIEYIDNIHPAFRLATMPYYAVTDLEKYGCFRTDINYSRNDGPFDTRSPEVAAKVSPFVAAKEPQRPSHTDIITFNDLSRIRNDTFRIFLGNAIECKDHLWIDARYYLDLSDHYRDTIERNVAMHDEEVEMLSSTLETILELEIIGESPLPYPTIVYTRLEKLLKCIIHHRGNAQLISQANFQNMVRLAVTIERKWNMQYKDHLFNVASERLTFMVTYGLLAHVSVQPSAKGDGSASWVADKRWRGTGTDLLDFPLGHWWPNLVCAVRDGAVNLTKHKKNSDYQHVTYLILLKGIERFDMQSGFMMYEIEGNLENVFLYLQEKVGTKVRLIRGDKLKSVNAPKMGIRYDGMHVLRRFSLLLLEKDKFKYRVVLYYDAVKGESSIDDRECTKPSTRDDWELYKSYEKAEMKRHCSESGYNAWQIGEEQDLTEHQEWNRREKLKVHAGRRYN